MQNGNIEQKFFDAGAISRTGAGIEEEDGSYRN